MNKLISRTLLLLITITLTSCNLFDSNDLSFEMIAFNSLTVEESELIPVSPKDSFVEKVPVTSENKPLIDKNYDKSEVFSVTFHHTEVDSSGKLTVFIDLDEKTVVGKGFTNK
ncbi:hypothetical protein [Evansella cellulosilytica]|uniref:Lipoprotein n=1 Tax=Evansella cellulosilytica (strain ATCC 21833 / DSM 2522 / FERM P-1141 / JCM 9156 / N-4) TaxID=649639 RepID=E6TVW8_EVAC2|nr:hypothetical protein [Evansella cellulosilytica]ADU28677.1 hypothetical protein Bcell_0395 [Evansella cellulosilytica DSM 2522]